MTGGGAQRRTLTLVKEFARRGHRVDLVTVMDGGMLAAEIPSAVRCFTIQSQWLRLLPVKGLRKIKLFCSGKVLADYLRHQRPDVLLSAASHASLTAIAGRKIAGTGTPLVLRLSSHLTASHAGNLRPLSRFRYRVACRSFSEVDAVIAVSQGIADDIVAKTRLAPKRIRTIYNPTFSEDLLAKSSAPLDHPWLNGHGPPVILGVGRLTMRKDFQNLIRAFAVVRRQRSVRLVILGEGVQRGELTSLARELGVYSDVDMPGFVDNPLAWMSRASVFVLSSICEGLPGVLIEAMAAGCPVVSTDCPSGPAEILQNGRYGSLVPVGDTLSLAGSIMTTLDCPHEGELLRARAAYFSVPKAVDEYLEVLTEAAGKNTP